MAIFDVQYQERAHRIIQRALASQRMPHAYLFAGPEGVGREMFAHRLAQTLLCASPVRRPMPQSLRAATTNGHGRDACGECQDCRLAAAGTHPDLFLVHRQLNRQHPDSVIRKQKALFLGVEVTRYFVVDRVVLCPSRGRAKVFIIREAERLNDAAQNSLLKTLEEPPKDTFLILVTTALDRMLPTTRSRCQQVLFQSLPADFLAEQVTTLRPDAQPGEIDYVSRYADGSLGLALRLIDDGLYPLAKGWCDRLTALLGSSPGFSPHTLAVPFLADAKELAKGVTQRDADVSDTDATRVGVQTLLGVLADFYLAAMRKGVGAATSSREASWAGVIDRLAAMQTPQTLGLALRHLSEANANLQRSANIDLTLEVLFIRLARCPAGHG